MVIPTSTPLFGRVITAMITPFDSAGNVDYDGAVRVAEHLVAIGSDGLVVSGTTGESPTLTHDEKIQLFKTIVKAVGGRAKVLAGTGSYNTAETIALSQDAEKCGVDGLLVVAPYYNKPSQEGLFQHFTAVAEATSAPIMLYNVPGRTITNIEAATTVRLAEHPRIVAIKEASGDMVQVGRIAHDAPADFLIYSGADEHNLGMLALGSIGVVSVTSHVIGTDVAKIYTAWFAGDIETARKLHLKSLAIQKALFSFPSPGPTKIALSLLGVTSDPRVRLPLVPATEKEVDTVRTALRDYGVLKS